MKFELSPSLATNISRSTIQSLHRNKKYKLASLTYQDHVLVICPVSPGDLDLQKYIIDACVNSGVRRFVANESDFDSRKSGLQRRLPSYKTRNELTQYLGSVKAHQKETMDVADSLYLESKELTAVAGSWTI
jgi:hypothetical protein